MTPCSMCPLSKLRTWWKNTLNMAEALAFADISRPVYVALLHAPNLRREGRGMQAKNAERISSPSRSGKESEAISDSDGL